MTDIKKFSSREKISSVTFRCKYFTEFGSSLLVVGNLKLLGHWETNNAIPLTTSANDYPFWTLKNAFSCAVGTEVLYKYLIKDANGNITWESLPNNMNRKKIISKPGEFIIEDEENVIKPEMGETENYDRLIGDEDVNPKKKKKKGSGTNKKTKKNKDNDKSDNKSKDENRINLNNIPRIKSGEDTFPNKLYVPIKEDDQNEILENEDAKICNDELRNNPNIIDLKFNLEPDFKIDDKFMYDINLINKINSGLFESFLFSSNQNIGDGDRLVLVEEFLPLTLKKNENCPEEEEDNRYFIIPNARYISIENFAKKVNCSVCWVGMLKNAEDFDEIELEEIYAFLEKKMIFVVEVSKNLYEDRIKALINKNNSLKIKLEDLRIKNLAYYEELERYKNLNQNNIDKLLLRKEKEISQYRGQITQLKMEIGTLQKRADERMKNNINSATMTGFKKIKPIYQNKKDNIKELRKTDSDFFVTKPKGVFGGDKKIVINSKIMKKNNDENKFDKKISKIKIKDNKED